MPQRLVQLPVVPSQLAQRCRIALSLRQGERGASLVEYALLVALIAIAALGSLQMLGVAQGGSIDNSASLIRSAVGP